MFLMRKYFCNRDKMLNRINKTNKIESLILNNIVYFIFNIFVKAIFRYVIFNINIFINGYHFKHFGFKSSTYLCYYRFGSNLCTLNFDIGNPIIM